MTGEGQAHLFNININKTKKGQNLDDKYSRTKLATIQQKKKRDRSKSNKDKKFLQQKIGVKTIGDFLIKHPIGFSQKYAKFSKRILSMKRKRPSGSPEERHNRSVQNWEEEKQYQTNKKFSPVFDRNDETKIKNMGRSGILST